MERKELQRQIAQEIEVVKTRAAKLEALFAQMRFVEDDGPYFDAESASAESREKEDKQESSNPQETCDERKEPNAQRVRRSGRVEVETVYSDASAIASGFVPPTGAVFGSANSPRVFGDAISASNHGAADYYSRQSAFEAVSHISESIVEEALEEVDLSRKVGIGDRVVLVKEPYHGRTARVLRARGTGYWTLALDDRQAHEAKEVFKMKCNCWLVR